MSGTKRWIEELDEKRGIATGLALKAGALMRCEDHGDLFAGPEDPEAAYLLANAKYSAGTITVFDSPLDMTKTIKSVIDDHPLDECPSCEKNREED